MAELWSWVARVALAFCLATPRACRQSVRIAAVRRRTSTLRQVTHRDCLCQSGWACACAWVATHARARHSQTRRRADTNRGTRGPCLCAWARHSSMHRPGCRQPRVQAPCQPSLPSLPSLGALGPTSPHQSLVRLTSAQDARFCRRLGVPHHCGRASPGYAGWGGGGARRPGRPADASTTGASSPVACRLPLQIGTSLNHGRTRVAPYAFQTFNTGIWVSYLISTLGPRSRNLRRRRDSWRTHTCLLEDSRFRPIRSGLRRLPL